MRKRICKADKFPQKASDLMRRMLTNHKFILIPCKSRTTSVIIQPPICLFSSGILPERCICVVKNTKISPPPLTKRGGMGRIKPIRMFFRERRGMVMGRRILAVLAALLVLLWAAVPAYAASPAVDRAYLTREPWQNVPFTEFQGDGANMKQKAY